MTPRAIFLIGWLVPATAAGQVATVSPDTSEVPVALDPDDVLGAAKRAQASFERTRLRHARVGFGGGVGPCDEYVGRFCTSYSEGEWYPREEDEGIVEARTELVERLDSLQLLAPADGWILGQRVWYRAEMGDWAAAWSTARRCGPVERWWCRALEGLANHGGGRWAQADRAFGMALLEMDPERAREWRVPERAVDGEGRAFLREAMTLGDAVLDSALGSLWALADPLYLVEGNDRRTAHYARWTVSEIRREARNPYGFSWADDLEELTVRHGWELGYELNRRSLGWGRDGAIGHKHPEGRDYMPPGKALRRPGEAAAEDLIAGGAAPRSLYAPSYAPLVLPTEPQVVVFPRPDGAVVVATSYLPEDTTIHAGHDHPRPWLEGGDQADIPDRIGLFALAAGGARPVRGATAESTEGALLIDVPIGQYVISAETFSPARRRAGRYRAGVRIDPPTPDVATTSDLLLLRGGIDTPTTLEEALPATLPRARIAPADPIAIVWEVSGLGFREETLEYAVSVERTDRNVFRRVGEFFGLANRPQPLALAWEEPAPEHPTHQFRHLDLDLPSLDPGRYEITLTLRTQGRSDVEVTKAFEVVEPQ